MFARRQIWECEIHGSLRKTGRLLSKDIVADAAVAFVVKSWREGPHNRRVSMEINVFNQAVHRKATPTRSWAVRES